MKKRYLAFGIVQLLAICLSGWLRRASWGDIDFPSGARSSGAQFSLYCLGAWLATIAIAVWFSVVDKLNRSMIFLFIVLLLPSIEFFAWFALSF